MNYYDELGLDQSATSDEIRRAYKRLTKLLHPDHQQDPVLRDLADRQMKRLNEIQELLTNRDTRAAYDREIANHSSVLHPQPSPEFVQHVSRPPVWLVGARILTWGWTWVTVAIAGMVIFAAWFPDPPAPDQSELRQPLSAMSDTRRPTKQLSLKDRSALPRPRQQSETAPPEQVDLRHTAPPSNAGSRHLSETSTPQNSRLKKALSAGAGEDLSAARLPRNSSSALDIAKPVAEPSANLQPPSATDKQPDPLMPLNDRASTLSGSWLYSISPSDRRDPKQYAAEYIELKISEIDEKLQGEYRGNYFVADKPISPRVVFTFEGESKSGEFLWRGAAGASGKVKLRRTSAHSLEITWFATEMGSELGLGSGSAVLYRMQQ